VFGAHRGMYGLSLAALVAGLVIRFEVLGQSAPRVIITPPELNILAYESTGVRMLTAVKILGLAAFKFLWPLPLSFDYGTATITPVRTPFAAGFLGALACWSLAIGWAWQRARREPLILTGLLIVLGALLPVSNLLLPITTIFNERLLYLPTVGLALLVVSVPGEGWRRWWVPALLVVVTAAGFLSWRRTGDWHDVASITEATAAASPRSANALMGLAEWRAGQGDIAAQGDALQRAVAAFPTSPRANYALGQWYQRQNDPARAMVHYEVSLTDRPTQTSLKAAMKLGFLNATSGHEETAVTYYRRALAINPNEPGAHFNLALLLRNLGDPDWERHAAIAARLGRPVPARND
jgi:Flp pilus assembly protein TadD